MTNQQFDNICRVRRIAAKELPSGCAVISPAEPNNRNQTYTFRFQYGGRRETDAFTAELIEDVDREPELLERLRAITRTLMSLRG